MNIAQIQKNSFIDFPEKIATVLFTQGCNFHCPYCHNSFLIPVKKNKKVNIEKEILPLLQFKQGIVISGGEPTIHSDLPDFISELKSFTDLPIKIDTNGSNPVILNKILSILNEQDFIAMDIKTTLHKYIKLSNLLDIQERIKKSVDLILASNINYTFRTTCFPDIVTVDDFVSISYLVFGAKSFHLQQFIPSLSPTPNINPLFTIQDLYNIKTTLSATVDDIQILNIS